MQEDAQDSSDDTDEEKWKPIQTAAGSMEVVNRTLCGIAARSADDGSRGFGRHAEIIRMGRALWQTPPITGSRAEKITETFCDDGRFPPSQESKAAFAAKRSVKEHITNPFEGKTLPYSHLNVHNYGERMTSWIKQLMNTKPVPAGEDLHVLQAVSDRILVEFEPEQLDCQRAKMIL